MKAIDHVADEELNVQENNSKAVHLVSYPKVSECYREEGSKEDTTLWWLGEGKGGRERERCQILWCSCEMYNNILIMFN